MAQNTVLNFIVAANPAVVAQRYRELFVDDDWANQDAFLLYRKLVQESMPVSNRTSVIVRRSDDGAPEVIGSAGPAEFLSLTFAPWGEWRTMEVIDQHGGLDADGLAAALYYVMTFHGWPEDRIARMDALMDMFEKFDREMA